MSKGLRLFIAIELPEALIRHIGDVIERLGREGLPGIRWVRTEGIHLTLKFLGNTPESLVQPIIGAMRTATADVAPFVLQVQGAGAFPHIRAPRVLWTGVQGDLEPLIHIRGRLEQALETQGFARDQRAFSPHLTLGRINGRLSPQELERLDQAIEEIRGLEPVELPATALSLMESRLTRGGAVYRRKAQLPLKNGLAGPSRS